MQDLERDLPLEDLLARCAMGNRDAFHSLYLRTAPQLLASLLRILKTREAAEDALQEVFVSVWRRARDYRRERGAPLTWLTSIARYRALDQLRSRRREISLEAAGARALETQSAPSPAGSAAEAGKLEGCLRELTAEQQNCIHLAYLEGLTHKEIAQTLGAPLGTAKSWLRRGLQALKRCMER